MTDETISRAVLKTLAECGPGRSLRLDPLTSYANTDLAVYTGRDAVQGALNYLESHGMVRKEASPLNPAVFSWSITAAGSAVAATLG
jgi:hypothetical protein